MIVSVDIGTSSVKVALTDLEGSVVKWVSQPVETLTPEPGAAEHDLEVLYQALLRGMKSVVKGYESDVEAITFSCYLHGIALLNREKRAVTRVFTHLDTRAGRYQSTVENYGRELYLRTGCPPLFVYPLVKLLWLRERLGLSGRYYVTFVKDYLIHRLTGLTVLDYGTASGTGLMNIHSLRWDDLALELAGVDESSLPELTEGASVVERVSIPELNLEGVALVPGSFDGALQNIGYSAYGEEAVLNLGSTAVIRTLRSEVITDRDPRMRFFCYYAADGYRAIGAASNNGMSSLEWVRENILGGVDWSTLVDEVSKIRPCSDGVLVLPFIGGERFPYRDPYLRFTLLGPAVSHSRAHVARASLEGVAFILKAIVDALEENGVITRTLHCGGGGCSIGSLVRVVADTCCKPVVVYGGDVARLASSIGAAAVAVRALGYSARLDTVKFDCVSRSRLDTIIPDVSTCSVYRECFSRFSEVLSSVSDIYRRLLC
jgi:gluconokinase